MDDTCAVCADVLEWVAYGACGHREVCATCVARLRFICEDRRCCICQDEPSVLFVTKALGDFTRMITDFTLLPNEPREGPVGSYWYHEDTQAFFDDVDQYRMIKAMCRLTCSECDKLDEESNHGSRRRPQKFKNIDQLKGHLYHRHKLFMCSLCLEGRKVFVCEQKLYTRAQLKQHTRTGDSEVDGNESERGGFRGHPMCEACEVPFYGDNELYNHMTEKHETCFLCRRQNQWDFLYYKNYNDLEDHFRSAHFLCENESCLAKGFTVFPTEIEMKKHNTEVHSGHMSRSKRNTVLQIPTGFHFRPRNEQYRHNEQDRRGRGRTFRRDRSDNQLSIAESSSHDPSPSALASSAPADVYDIDPVIPSFEALTATDSEASSRYLQALGQGSRNASLQESLFPPLLAAPSSSQPRNKPESESWPNNSMAAHLRRQNKRSPTATTQGWPAAVSSSAHAWPAVSSGQGWPAAGRARGPSGSMLHRPVLSSPMAPSSSAKPVLPGFPISSQVQVQSAAVHGRFPTGSSGNLVNASRTSHSSSAPNLVVGQLKSSNSDFPPVSAIQVRSGGGGSQVLPNVEDVQTANRSLVEKIRAALEYDENKYSLFKDVSGQYRLGAIDTGKYLDYVKQYGLSHLIIELARLCPDDEKQKEMVDTYNASLRSKRQDNGSDNRSANVKYSQDLRKGKGKKVVEANSSSDRLADNVMDTVRTLQSNYKHGEQDVEVLSKDGYRPARGKSTLVMKDEQREVGIGSGNGSNHNSTGGSSASKQRKKTSKFQRVRLGDGSMAALLDLQNADPDPVDKRLDGDNWPTPVVRGAWRKGGQNLFPGQ